MYALSFATFAYLGHARDPGKAQLKAGSRLLLARFTLFYKVMWVGSSPLAIMEPRRTHRMRPETTSKSSVNNQRSFYVVDPDHNKGTR